MNFDKECEIEYERDILKFAESGIEECTNLSNLFSKIAQHEIEYNKLYNTNKADTSSFRSYIDNRQSILNDLNIAAEKLRDVIIELEWS